MSKTEYAWVIQRDDGKFLQRIFYNKYGTLVYSFTNKKERSHQFSNYSKALTELAKTKNCKIIEIEKPLYNIGFAKTKHNGRKDRLYAIWSSIKQRCCNEGDKSYKNYGGRGIKMCNEWLDYSNFRDWAYNNGYDKNAQTNKCTIDRIDNNGNYEPDNCRWVDRKEQNKNKRNNHLITFNNETKTLLEWAKEYSINPFTLLNRINAGWDIKKALNKKVARYKKIRVVGE